MTWVRRWAVCIMAQQVAAVHIQIYLLCRIYTSIPTNTTYYYCVQIHSLIWDRFLFSFLFLFHNSMHVKCISVSVWCWAVQKGWLYTSNDIWKNCIYRRCHNQLCYHIIHTHIWTADNEKDFRKKGLYFFVWENANNETDIEKDLEYSDCINSLSPNRFIV